MRIPLVLTLLLLALGCSDPPTGRDRDVRFTALPLDRDHPQRRTVGALRYLGGWQLTSRAAAFGGLSSLHVAQGKVLAVSDAAQLVRFRLPGRTMRSALSIRPVPGIFSPGNDEPDRDSESMALDPASGHVWLGFETSNAIRRFNPGLRHKQGWAAPAAMRDWPENLGPEAMVRLRDGSFLVFSEATQGMAGAYRVLRFASDPVHRPNAAARFLYRPPAGFHPTDAAQLPDGRLLVLNRHFSVFDGIAASLTLLDPRAVRAGRIVEGREIARLAPPLTVDNMEGLSLEAGKRGQIIVWLVSDDNFNPLQRTLLLRFALDPQRLR